jgi:hypothetical protein
MEDVSEQGACLFIRKFSTVLPGELSEFAGSGRVEEFGRVSRERPS